MKKPVGAKGPAELAPLPKMPVHSYDEKTANPIWEMQLPVDVERMDHSMSLMQHLGNIKDSTGKTGDVSLALGGFVFVVTVNSKRGPSRRYALDICQAIETVFQLDDKMRKVPEAQRPGPPVPDLKGALALALPKPRAKARSKK